MVSRDIIAVHWSQSRFGNPVLVIGGQRYRRCGQIVYGRGTWRCIKSDLGCKSYAITQFNHVIAVGNSHTSHNKKKIVSRNKKRKNLFYSKIRINGKGL
ncbi:unnamed protein product [Euphydryas editha]|uniref:FLYWCH-type domain-containing protein n=1 Tax=Euphydryas editha TaxID=104508 RepID=A0AAU9TDI4_EUPED|nr:unnamed protein product [Euphydryas editha]